MKSLNRLPARAESAARGVDDEVRLRYEELYRDRHVSSVKLACLLTGDPIVAEELVQEAFLRLLSHDGDVQNPPGFLRTVLVNLCRDHGRRRATAIRYRAERPSSTPAPDLPRSVDATWIAVQGLPVRRRDAIVLRYYADLSTDEIARLLGVRPATVRSLIRRALRTLQEELTDDR